MTGKPFKKNICAETLSLNVSLGQIVDLIWYDSKNKLKLGNVDCVRFTTTTTRLLLFYMIET